MATIKKDVFIKRVGDKFGYIVGSKATVMSILVANYNDLFLSDNEIEYWGGQLTTTMFKSCLNKGETLSRTIRGKKYFIYSN
jgi:hypothetical protein